LKVHCLIFLILTSFLSGCSGIKYHKTIDDSLKIKKLDNSVNPIFFGEVEPPIPSKEEIEDQEIGIDRNNNGIRDDIDIFINRTFKEYNFVMAARQFAKTYENFYRKQVEWEKIKKEIDEAKKIKNNSNNIDKIRIRLDLVGQSVNADADLMLRAQGCVDYLSYQEGKREFSSLIWAIGPITMYPSHREELFEKRLRGIRELKGMGPTPRYEYYKQCTFQLEDLENYIQLYKEMDKKR
jgi:hypothetical protein